MQARMKNPAAVMPEALEPLVALGKIISSGPVASKTLGLVHLRVSQINGCAACVDLGLNKQEDTPRRLAHVAVWRESPFFSDAERAALSLAESVTRIADATDRVPDDVWNEATRHFDERSLASLVLYVGVTNLYNRLNVTTRQVAGERNW